MIFDVVCSTARAVSVRLFDADGRTVIATHPLEAAGDHRWTADVPAAEVGSLYKYVLDEEEVPDPFARFLPFGVHGPARVCARGDEPPLADPPSDWSIYELHVGTFSPEGTYAGAIAKLDRVADLGVTAIELMPLSSFPGKRGWGYDGVAPFAPFAPYGEPDDLRRLVREAHARGLAVVLDVVYNHFGPDGNYFARYAPEYFHQSANTPWGQSPAFDFAPMRALVTDNARYWFEEFGFDGLRLDATATIEDARAPHVLREVSDLAHALGRRVFFEDDRNDPRVLLEYAADGVWADDFHHHVHVLMTGERDGYYAAYAPTVAALARCIDEGWSFSGQPYAPWKDRPRGKPLGDVDHQRLVTCIQNHDQIGNRATGNRLSSQIDATSFAALARLLLFLPSTPLLFMGQEWAASAPFLYFTDHHGELGEAVSKGRREEFGGFSSFAESEVPDPQAESTFLRSKLDWSERGKPEHALVLEAHREALRLRKELLGPAKATAEGDVLRVTRGTYTLRIDFGKRPIAVTLA